MKKGLIVFGVIFLTLVLPFSNAGIFDWFKNARASPSVPTNVDVTVGNSLPTITNVQTVTRGPNVGRVQLLGGTTADVYFNFTVQDGNGVSDLNDASAAARFNMTGEPIRIATCTPVANLGNQRTYQCFVQMQYFDNDGVWQVNVSVKDNSGAYVFNIANSFSVDSLKDISISPNAISFSGLSSGATNSLAAQNTTVANSGNFVVPTDGPLSITASNLVGQTNPSENIPAVNFKVIGSIGAATVCTAGTSLDATLSKTVPSFNLPRGASGNTDKIVYCLTSVPVISSQTYATGGSGWIISI